MGFSFNDNAFSDYVRTTNYTGSYDSCNGTVINNYEEAIIGFDLNSWINYGSHDFLPGYDGTYNSAAPPTQYIELGFSDNQIINNDGDDIVIFEMGSPNAALVALDLHSIQNPWDVNSQTVIVETSWSQSPDATNNCNVAISLGAVDLSDLGVCDGCSVDRIYISSPIGIYGEVCWSSTGYSNLGVPEIAGVGALHSSERVNTPPEVDAGELKIISLPIDHVELQASVIDDHLPALTAMTYAWELFSGPEAVLIQNENSLTTNVTFPAPGEYIFQFNANDGEYSGADFVTVLVTDQDNENPSIPNNLSGVAISDNRIRLTWSPSLDNVAISGYEISRNGIFIDYSETNQWTDSSLEVLTNYSYSIHSIDISGNVSGESLSVSVQSMGNVFERRISTSAGDAEEGENGTVQLSSSDLELVYEYGPGNQIVGLYFNDLNLPKNSQIIKAYIEFTADEIGLSETALTISVEDSLNPTIFSSETGNISSRQMLPTTISWSNIEPWLAEHYRHVSPDISPLIQEKVDNDLWTEGNSIVFTISGTGKRTAKSFNGGELVAPLLHVEYSTGTPLNRAPSVSAGGDITLSLPENTVTLSGNVTDDGLPEGSTVTVNWSQVSGPSAVQFTNADMPDTQAEFGEIGTYILSLTAFDGEFISSDTLSVTVTEPDNQAPAEPTGLTATALSGTEIVLAWNATTDNIAVAGYEIYRDGFLIQTVSGTSYTDTGLSGETLYTYTVIAFDASGNYSIESLPADATTFEDMTIVEKRIAIGSDDAEEGENGSIQLSSSDIELVT
ncbi:MAG: hypothetical protein KKG99_10095, partial [Bacteroidetes bacterium]|nr:hypothetical protein [Bacteroidota bacterium]